MVLEEYVSENQLFPYNTVIDMQALVRLTSQLYGLVDTRPHR